MFRMLFLALAALVITAGWFYSSYGEVDPCRALAAEQARHAAHGLPVKTALERINRIRTSQMSTGECLKDLVGDWWRHGRAR
jgi:hypothetical protein